MLSYTYTDYNFSKLLNICIDLRRYVCDIEECLQILWERVFLCLVRGRPKEYLFVFLKTFIYMYLR